MSKNTTLLSLILVVLLAIGFSFSGSKNVTPTTSTNGACSFTALDVGQGDALLIQTSDHQDILIDGGPNQKVVDTLSQELPIGDRDIELMVLTHPHADHVNGLVAVTERFAVRHVLETGVTFKQQAYETWHKLLSAQHAPSDIAVSGQRYEVGAAILDVLWPSTDLTKIPIMKDDAANGGGVNDASVVLRLTCGGSVVMLMGDASSEIEDRILDNGATVQANLLKVGHHGSRFSTSKRFLEAVQPLMAVISDGAGNRYKHPHPSTLLRLEQAHVPILRTDLLGIIRLKTDGQGGWVKVDK